MRFVFVSFVVVSLALSIYFQPTPNTEILITDEQSPSPSPAPSVIPSPTTVPSPADEYKKLQDLLKRLDGFEKHGSVDAEVYGDEREGKLNVTFTPGNQGAERETYRFDLPGLLLPPLEIAKIISSVFNNKGGPGTLPGVAVRQFGATEEYEVVLDYGYTWKGYNITVPQGFRYDRASIPAVFWSVIDKDSLSNVAPLFHDLLYRHGGKLPVKLVIPYRTFTREEADELFLHLMEKCGVTQGRREIAYKAVRRHAESSWKIKK